MIYFDNSATTFPKPKSVAAAVSRAVAVYGGNPGRGGHSVSMRAAEAVFSARESAAELFGASSENTIFTLNATHALNMAIKGVMNGSGHIIISSLEHNAVARPVYALASRTDVTYSVADIAEDDEVTISNFESLIRRDTKCICCTVGSNVTGKVAPYRELAQLCRERGICFIGDASQAAGVIPLKLSDGFSILCMSGHKGLYGPTGTGLLITDGSFPISTIIEGGTGATSAELEQTGSLPEKLESGTLNSAGIIGLGEGIRFVKRIGIQNIRSKEDRLCRIFIAGLSNTPGCVVYRSGKGEYLPVVSFNLKGLTSQQVASYLDKRGFALRGGLQCAALAHRKLGTTEVGTVRFSPAYFNNDGQVFALIKAIREIKV